MVNQEVSQRALDHASQAIGYKNWEEAKQIYKPRCLASIQAHARTLDQLWAICPDLAPKTKGQLFGEEMLRRRGGGYELLSRIAAQMIDENWEPKP